MSSVDGTVEQVFVYSGARYTKPIGSEIIYSEPVVNSTNNRPMIELWVWTPLSIENTLSSTHQPAEVSKSISPQRIRSISSEYVLDQNNSGDIYEDHIEELDEYDYEEDIDDGYHYD